MNSESVKAPEYATKIDNYLDKTISWCIQMKTRSFSKRYTFTRCESFMQYQFGMLISPRNSQVLKIQDLSVSISKIFQRHRLSSIQDLDCFILYSWSPL